LQRIGNLLPRRPARVAAHGLLDRLQFLFQDAPYHVASLSCVCACTRNLAWICAIFNDTRNHPALRANHNCAYNPFLRVEGEATAPIFKLAMAHRCGSRCEREGCCQRLAHNSTIPEAQGACACDASSGRNRRFLPDLPSAHEPHRILAPLSRARPMRPQKGPLYKRLIEHRVREASADTPATVTGLDPILSDLGTHT
jgi:hypothetical protein